jgi:5-methyltetrahydrofolate--homocysteine methyltransferase
VSEGYGFSEVLLAGNPGRVEEIVHEALKTGVAAETIINTGLIPAMELVGDKFKNNEVFLPEVMMAARAMQAGLKILQPLLTKESATKNGRVVMGTVRGDHHDIGKNLVATMLEGAGFEVVDLGADVPVEKFVEAVQNHHPEVVGLSALLTTTMPAMKETIVALETAGLRDQVKIMIGGAPVTQEYADRIGADGYSEDAGAAVELAKALVQALAEK